MADNEVGTMERKYQCPWYLRQQGSCLKRAVLCCNRCSIPDKLIGKKRIEHGRGVNAIDREKLEAEVFEFMSKNDVGLAKVAIGVNHSQAVVTSPYHKYLRTVQRKKQEAVGLAEK